jgi:hypothetical protein
MAQPVGETLTVLEEMAQGNLDRMKESNLPETVEPEFLSQGLE